MIRLKTERNNLATTRADVIALPVFEGKEGMRAVSAALAGLPGRPALPSAGFTGKLQQTIPLFPPRIRAKSLLLVGAGKPEELTAERLRRIAATAARSAEATGAKTVAMFEPFRDIGIVSLPNDIRSWEDVGRCLSEGALLGLYRYDKYQSADRRPKKTIGTVTLVGTSPDQVRALDRGARKALVVCEATIAARDLENAPGNEIDPVSLADRARKLGREAKLRVSVWDERKIRKIKMGGLLGVGQGSAKPPRLIILEHRHARSRGTVALVGKGVTFDSGGISIKPSANMAEMKMDMSGAAAVLGTMYAAGRMRLPVHIVGIIPAAENLPGGSALKPGDIIRHYNGKTSEVDNTDAEGRLILADALSYAERYRPDLVVDLATLTGAVVVALGHVATGMMGNDEQTMARLKEAGERTYERVWQLPMYEEYEKLVKSDIADVKNTGGRWAGAITGAVFLKSFIGKYKWVHLDIAGTAIMEEASDYIPKGGSGVGVRLLVEFLEQWRR